MHTVGSQFAMKGFGFGARASSVLQRARGLSIKEQEAGLSGLQAEQVISDISSAGTPSGALFDFAPTQLH